MGQAIELVLANPVVWLVVLLSAASGIFIGSIPGLTATMAVALLVPITYWLEPVAALAAVVTMVACAIFAGDIPTTLLRIPGTPASAAYADDAKALSRQGRSDYALGIALVCSAAGGLLGAVVLMLLGQQLARIAAAFSAPEYFWLYLLGLGSAVLVSHGSKLRALLSLTIGLMLATVGLSAVHSEARFTFGQPELFGGISFIPAMIGLFGVSEVLKNLVELRGGTGDLTQQESPARSNTGKSQVGVVRRLVIAPVQSVLGAGSALLWRRKVSAVRSAGIGSLIGMLPGAGADIAAWVSLAVSKRLSKRPDTYGRGSDEGIADATTANSSALAGAWIPALVFGIPGDSVTAIVIGVLLMKNITPGPEIFVKQASLVYGIYLIFILANLVLIPVGFVAIKAGGYIVRIPRRVLLPIILLFCILGSYALNASYFDVGTMLVMGLLGFVLERRKFPLAPIVLGLILGPPLEERFIQTVTGADGVLSAFFNPERPVALGLGLVFVALWILAITRGRATG